MFAKYFLFAILILKSIAVFSYDTAFESTEKRNTKSCYTYSCMLSVTGLIGGAAIAVHYSSPATPLEVRYQITMVTLLSCYLTGYLIGHEIDSSLK